MAEPEVDEKVEPEEPQAEPEEQVETPTEEAEPVEEVAEEAEEQDPEPEPERKPSRRESLRIQALVSKLKAAENRATAPEPPSGLKYAEALEADPETVKALEADRQKFGDAFYQQGLNQARSIQFHTRLEIDAPQVASRYPQFDKNSPQFNPVATDAINQWYLSTVGYDPKSDTVRSADVRYSEFVDGVMELADEMAGDKVAKSQKNIAKQAAATGIRPSGATPKRMNLNQAPQNMSDEELDAVIALGIPKK